MAMVFDSFELDTSAHELRNAGSAIGVEPQVFDLLVLLVENAGQLVSKDELVNSVWKGRVVSDAAISSRIKAARQALGDDGSRQRYIKTVHGRGFRFVGTLQTDTAGPSTPSTRSAGAAVDCSTTIAPAVLPAADGSTMLLGRPSVVVLRFDNHSDDRRTDYLVDGVADGLIAALSAWRTFPVISRNTAFLYSGQDRSTARVRRETGASYVVTGFVQLHNGKAQVSVELIDSRTDQQLWGGRFVRPVGDLFELEEAIARSIINELEPEITAAEQRRIARKNPDDYTAWDLAMRALWHINRWSRSDYDAAEQLAQGAAERCPDWAYPRGLLAFIAFQRAMSGFSTANSATAFSPTLEAATAALDVDQNAWIAQALAAVGELWTHGDHDRALGRVRRAIELNPSASWPYHFCGCISGFSGSLGAASSAQESVYSVDPAYPYTAVVEADLALWDLEEGQLDDAVAHIDRSISIDPNYARAVQRKIAIHGLRGEREQAASAIARLGELGGTFDRRYFENSYPFRNPLHREVFLEGLSAAGMRL